MIFYKLDILFDRLKIDYKKTIDLNIKGLIE